MLAKELELSLALLYSQLAIESPKDKKFWLQMSREEESHARIIEKSTRIFSKDSRYTSINIAIINRMKNFIARIKDDAEEIKKSSISRKAAFNLAMEYEQSAIELHYHNILGEIKTKEINKLLSSLQNMDKLHFSRLLEYSKMLS